MAYTIEKVLQDARMLVNRLKEHDCTADGLITQTQTLYKRVDAMKMYQEDLNELNEMARHRPRSTLVLGIAQENSQIRELQQENKELRISLEEHQSAVELIMSKYREQILKLMMANKVDHNVVNSDQSCEMQEKIDKIAEMAAVMQKAATMDDDRFVREQELMTQLKTENKTLRDLLQISMMNLARVDVETSEIEVQTDEEDEQKKGDDAKSAST